MNIYRISYTTSDAETGTANITERSETAARKAFKASCKAIGRTIPDVTDIELVGEGAGATKQQERDTLAAIMQMVEELGPESYLKTAFEGCFEDAEQNIENDFAFSMKARYDSATEDCEKLNDKIRLLQETIDRLQHEAEQKDIAIEKLTARRDELLEVSKFEVQKVTELGTQVGDFQRRAEEAEAEVIRLKAKLYDYIIAGA